MVDCGIVMAAAAMTERHVDVTICGAGPVGAACALFLRERGMPADRLAIVDARTADAAAADDRTFAISHGSATLFERLGAWSAIAPVATAIETIHVSHRGRFGRTVIDRRDEGVAALGYVVRHGDLTAALDAALGRAGVVVDRPQRVTAIDVDGTRLRVVATGAAWTTRHAVHAEGGLFGAAERRDIHRDYGQTAVTAFVTVTGPPAATAFERFTNDGPIALLPMVDRSGGKPVRGYALVWCGRPDDAAARIALSDAAFASALNDAFGDRLGRFASVGPRRAFPLGLSAVAVVARARSATAAEFAIGNAAQALHPVAGQGLNLGLRDAHALAARLARDEGVDAATLVARYRADRRLDRATTVDLTDAMPRIFGSAHPVLAFARGAALALLDVAPPLRSLFARQMMDGRR